MNILSDVCNVLSPHPSAVTVDGGPSLYLQDLSIHVNK